MLIRELPPIGLRGITAQIEELELEMNNQFTILNQEIAELENKDKKNQKKIIERINNLEFNLNAFAISAENTLARIDKNVKLIKKEVIGKEDEIETPEV